MLSLMFTCSLFSQQWKFIKEKDGIKLYSKQEAGKNNKTYKGITTINEKAEKVFAVLEDVHHTEWWDKNIIQIKILHYEKNKKTQYYLVYDMPWPLKDRDLTVDVTPTYNKTTGEYKLAGTPSTGKFPKNKDMIRIMDYRQIWILKSDKNRTLVELEFYLIPDENIPNWLLDMVMTDSPISTIKSLKSFIEK